MSDWNVEASGPNTILVVRRHKGRGPQQDLARNDAGRIIWFTSREEAQAHADRLNAEARQAHEVPDGGR